jgi:hypothetical protein
MSNLCIICRFLRGLPANPRTGALSSYARKDTLMGLKRTDLFATFELCDSANTLLECVVPLLVQAGDGALPY